MFTVKTTWTAATPINGRTPTIYHQLKALLGREPTNVELTNEVIRLLRETRSERASRR